MSVLQLDLRNVGYCRLFLIFFHFRWLYRMKKRDLSSRSVEASKVVNGKQKFQNLAHEMELLNPQSYYGTKVGDDEIR